MLSKEKVQEMRSHCDNCPESHPQTTISKATLRDICDMALQWASVQEGLKDAESAFQDLVTANGYSIETDPDGEYACPEVRLQKYAFMAGARHNAAFALKQKGEVVWEGNGSIGNSEHMTPELFVPSYHISNAGLKVGDLVHVTISLPQQEQE